MNPALFDQAKLGWGIEAKAAEFAKLPGRVRRDQSTTVNPVGLFENPPALIPAYNPVHDGGGAGCKGLDPVVSSARAICVLRANRENRIPVTHLMKAFLGIFNIGKYPCVIRQQQGDFSA
jgi:hypothetical protein